MTTETILTGEDTALVIANAESESHDEQASTPHKMTDAERLDAYKRVRPIAGKADKSLAEHEGKVAEQSLKFGQALLLVQSFQLWKAPKTKDERGHIVRQFSSYAKWYEGQSFKTTKSRGAQCVTVALDDFNSRTVEGQTEYAAELGFDNVADIVTFVANRQKGSTGRAITVESRAKQVLAAVEAFNEKIYALTLLSENEPLDETFSVVCSEIQVSLASNVRNALNTWAEGGEVDSDNWMNEGDDEDDEDEASA